MIDLSKLTHPGPWYIGVDDENTGDVHIAWYRPEGHRDFTDGKWGNPHPGFSVWSSLEYIKAERVRWVKAVPDPDSWELVAGHCPDPTDEPGPDEPGPYVPFKNP